MSEQNLKVERPLSPHLQQYKLPYNAVMSITGRAVGVALFIAVSVIFMWFIGVVWHPPLFELTMEFLRSPVMQYVTFGKLMLGVFVVCFYMGNGIRHVLWDMVIGVEVKFGVLSGNITLIASALITLGIGILVWSGGF